MVAIGATTAAVQTLALMPQQEVPDQIAAGWFAVEAPERTGSLQRSGSNSRLNAQAPEFVPRVAAVAPPPAVIRVFAVPSPPPRAAFFAAPPPPPPFEFFAPVRVGGAFVAEEPEPEMERATPAVAEPAVDGLTDEVVQKITKQVGVSCPVDAIGFRSNTYIRIDLMFIRRSCLSGISLAEIGF